MEVEWAGDSVWWVRGDLRWPSWRPSTPAPIPSDPALTTLKLRVLCKDGYL